MPGVEIQPTKTTQVSMGNDVKAIIQGSLSAFGDGFAFATIIVAAYVALLADRNLVVGIVPVLAYGLWNLGSGIVTLAHRANVGAKWIAAISQSGRAASMAAIAYVAFQEGSTNQDALRRVLVAYAAWAFLSGAGSTATTALYRESIGIASRSRVFLRRGVAGGLAVAVSGIVLHQLLSQQDVDTSRAFAYAFVAAAATMASSAFFVLTIRTGSTGAAGLNQKRTPRSALRDQTFQRFLAFRLLLAAAGLADIFLVVYALEELGLSYAFLGILVIASGVTMAISGTVWRLVSARSGGRSTLQLSAMLKLVPSLLALTTIYLAKSDFYTERRTDTLVFEICLAAAFVACSLASTSVNAGSFRYLSDSRLSLDSNAAGWTNIMVGIASAFALLGGWILQEWNYQTLFGAAIGCSLVATLVSGLLRDPRASMHRRTSPGVRFGLGYSRFTALGR